MGRTTPPKKQISLLEALEQCCNVDVDDVSTDVVNSIPFTPHNRRCLSKLEEMVTILIPR